jgi:hypothetical protein
MFYAAEGGNWALASYMSKYMDKAMNPAKITKPKEYPDWAAFYKEEFAPVNNAIAAQDMATFTKEYNAVIASCNDCHAGMGYGFIKVVKLASPRTRGSSTNWLPRRWMCRNNRPSLQNSTTDRLSDH